MEYNSFYGGKKGASFVIVSRYKTIVEMVNAFKQGSNYKTVNFDEYVIIDTENKNDKDNGKVYRRGYDYTNEQGGAEYIGQIVGTSGPAPHVEGKKISEIDDIIEVSGFDYRTSSGEFTTKEGLIPGKTSDGQYNDKIIYKACSIRNENNSESMVYIGFSFPYTVIEFTAESVDANTTGELATRLDNGEHPFFEQWKIKIPKGKRADSSKNIRVMIADTSIQNYSGRAEDIAHNRMVYVYDQWTYETSEEGTFKTYYIGDYNTIKNVELSDSGVLTISYTHKDTETVNLRKLIGAGAIAGKESDPKVAAAAEALTPYSIWMIVEE